MARILVADDASFMRQMIREIVEAEGHEVVAEASDGVEAIDMFKAHHPELVTHLLISFYRHPGMGVSQARYH